MFNKKRLIKESYGIAICRINKQPEILLCRRRITYAFGEFVCGKFHPKDYNKILKLLNNMTIQEKIDILSLDFDIIWWRFELLTINNMNNNQKTFYCYCKRKFKSNFLQDNGKKLTYWINNSYSNDLLWEIPKGRSDKGEKILDTAIRETKEESGINTDDYAIVFDISPLSYSIIEYNVIYKMHFYVAKYSGININNKFNNRHVKEVDSVKWWTLEDLNNINNTYTKRITIPILKKYNNYMKYNK